MTPASYQAQTPKGGGGTLLSNAALAVFLASAALFLPLAAHAATISKPANNLGLVGYWKFDEGTGTTAADFSGRGNTGTLISAPVWTSGKFGSALNFNGSSGYVSLGNPSSLSINGSVTVSAWVNLANTSGVKAIAGRWSSTSQHSYKIAALGGKFYMDVSGSGSGDNYLQTNTTLAVGRWYHVVGVYTAGVSPTLNVYVNGVLDNGVMTGSVPSSLYVGSSAVEIGRDGGNLFNGSVDDVRIYNRALSASEVKQIYAEGAGARVNTDTVANTSLTSGLVGYWSFNGPDVTDKVYDRSNTGANGYVYSSTATSSMKTIGKVGQAFKFNGTTDYISGIGDVDALDNHLHDATYAAWVKQSPGAAGGMVVQKSRYAAGSGRWAFEIQNGKIDLFLATDGTGDFDQIVGSVDVRDGKWHHVAVTLTRGGSAVSYVDGMQDGSASIANNFKSASNYNNPYHVLIGAYGDEAGLGLAKTGVADFGFFPGSLDEVRVYNRALSAAEIQQLYLAGK